MAELIMGKPPIPFLERFERCLPQGLPEDACWPWQGKPDRYGYGRIRRPFRGPSMLAHRAAWEAHHARPIPDGLLVCHACDNRLCVNPRHLFLGTFADNNHDRDRKGRQIRGITHHKSKLTPEQVLYIRFAFSSGRATKTELARMFGITDTSVHYIIIGRNWRHLS